MKNRIISKILIVILILMTCVCLINKTYCFNSYQTVEHLLINGILSYPSILNKDSRNLTALDENYITPTEFKKILRSIYDNDYILIRISDIVGTNTQKPSFKTLNLPPNKKPIILSINNVQYGQLGEVNKLIIERNDKIASYTSKRAINDRINYDKEFITILENFIEAHPDFSFKGARATIIVGGGKGIFGYKTQKTNANSKFQIKKCAEVVNFLKEKGWEFCAKAYNNESSEASSNLEFASSLNKWINNVKPILGQTPYFYLNEDVDNLTNFNYKSQLLLNSDFKIFLNNNFSHGFTTHQIFEDKAMILNTKKICGETLRLNRNDFLNMFDAEIIYDRLNRKIPF